MRYIWFVLLNILFFFLFGCGEIKNQEPIPKFLPVRTNFQQSLNGNKVDLFYLKNSNNYYAAITNYGARMVGFWIPHPNGTWSDVVLGFDILQTYIDADERFFGAIVGRFGNRIAKGRFTMDGVAYQLDLNNGVNTLHGGSKGFHSVVWSANQPDSQTLVLTYLSPDGDEGYPGALTTVVTYTLTNNNEIRMDYSLSSDKRTIANITNHNFWNLNGEGTGTINNHILQVDASRFTAVDSTLIPTSIDSVSGTPFDFRIAHKIGDLLNPANQQLAFGNGYDHNFVLDKGISMVPEKIATITGEISGIKMDILTTEPGLQFYGGNFMQSKNVLKSGSTDDFRTAFCLETQHFPDAPNRPDFPTTVIEPGKKYSSTTVYAFSLKQ